MLQNKQTSEEIIIKKLTSILDKIKKDNFTIEDAEWLLMAISYNNTIVIESNENINNLLYLIYQFISYQGISIKTLTSKEKALKILMDYTQFLEKEKVIHDPTNRTPFF